MSLSLTPEATRVSLHKRRPGARGQQHFGVVEGGWGEDAGRHRQMGRAQRKLWSVSSLRGVAESGVGTEGALGVFNAQVS